MTGAILIAIGAALGALVYRLTKRAIPTQLPPTRRRRPF